MKRDLPKHLYLEGTTYRAKPPGRPRVVLGTNREVAIQKFNVLMSLSVEVDVADPAIVMAMWKRHRKGARQRNLDFTVTPEEIGAILEKQGYRCAVTHLPFRDDKPDGMRVRPWAPSMDRLAGAKGYVPGNVRIVCCFVNVAMNGFGDDFFAQVLEPLVEARVKAELARLG